MSLNTDSLRILRDKARQLVARDRLSFLNSLSGETLQKGALLDLQHQTILRILAERRAFELQEIVDEYIAEPTKRVLHLDAVREITSLSSADIGNDDTDVSFDHTKTSGGYSYTSKIIDETLKPFEILAADLQDQDPGSIVFSTPLGFAYFPSESIHTDTTTEVRLLDTSEYASTGGMMYYGFNTGHGYPSYIQGSSVYTLSQTFAAIARAPRALLNRDKSPQPHVIHELVKYSQQTPDWSTSIERDTRKFLLAHESGHDPNHSGNKILFDTMSHFGIDPKSFYRIAFPSYDDLQAWPRIKSGQGTAKDVLFLLGDYLANMAFLKDSIHDPSHKLLQAFNWWLVKEPTLYSRPRGLTTFLAHSYQYDPDEYRTGLERIFLAVSRKPEKLERELREMELTGWQRLLKISSGLNAEMRPRL